MLALWIALGVVVYLNTGYWGSYFSRKSWNKGKRSLVGLLCFPVSFYKNCIGNDSVWKTSKGDDQLLVNDEDYQKMMAVGWPIKVVLNLIVVTSIVSYHIVENVLILVINPTSFLPKRAPKEISATQPAKPSAEPAPIPSDSYSESIDDEYQKILARHDKDIIRLKELEAEFAERKKVVSLPKRL